MNRLLTKARREVRESGVVWLPILEGPDGAVWTGLPEPTLQGAILAAVIQAGREEAFRRLNDAGKDLLQALTPTCCGRAMIATPSGSWACPTCGTDTPAPDA